MQQNYHQPLVPDCTYHLFSRAVGNEKLFISHDNYVYFLSKLKQHCHTVCHFYAYSLLPNHFHLLIKVKPAAAIIASFNEAKPKPFDDKIHLLTDFIMERFSNFLNGYTKAFNKMHNRKGALFMDYIKRSQANDDGDFAAFIWYVHKNAVHHTITNNIGEWQYDSYQSILSTAPTSLLREEVLNFFGGKDAFIKFHSQPVVVKDSFSGFKDV